MATHTEVGDYTKYRSPGEDTGPKLFLAEDIDEVTKHYEQCPIIQADLSVAELAKKQGHREYAASVERETVEKLNKCLGFVTCNGQIECGLLHGNTSANTINWTPPQD